MKKNKGYSLIELLVVIGLFALITTLVVQILFNSLKGARKSENTNLVRDDINQALGVISKNLYNAQKLTAVGTTNVNYKDQKGNDASFSCNSAGQYIASGSARLTSENILVTGCSFTKNTGAITGAPDAVTVNITAKTKDSTPSEAADVSVVSEIVLRVYEY